MLAASSAYLFACILFLIGSRFVSADVARQATLSAEPQLQENPA
jgi:hypothetical protein